MSTTMGSLSTNKKRRDASTRKGLPGEESRFRF